MKFRTRAVALLSLMTAATLSGCDVLFGSASQDAPPAFQEKEEPAVVDEVLAAVEPLVGGDSLPSSEKLFDALIDAGYPADGLEATQDASPLSNEVPAKMFAVKVKEGCVVGEIRKGKSRANLVPESDSMDTCLFGNVDRPKGAKEPSGEDMESGADDNGVGHLPGEDLNKRKDGGESSPQNSDGGADSGTVGDSGSGSGSGSGSLGGG